MTVVVALLGQLLVAASAGAASQPTAPTVSPAKPHLGSAFTVAGTVPGRFARTVRLQFWDGRKYITREKGRSSSSGRYSLSHTSRSTSLRVRVAISSGKRSGKSYSAVTTKSRTITLLPNTVSATAPRTAREKEAFTIDAATAPAVQGRQLHLDRQTGGTWTEVATSVSDANGAASFSVTPSRLPKEQKFRVRMVAAGSRPSATSEVYTVEIDPREAVAKLNITTNDDPATGDPAPIESGEEYVRGTMTLEPRDSGLTSFTLPGRFRVRGNSTAWARVKLSYKVKLDKKTSVAGFPASKDWALLGNFFDRSMLRNDVAFEAARRIGMPWAPRMQYAEVVVNGRFQGLYQLGENVEKATDRVALPTDGVLLEADHWESDDPFFTTSRGLQVNLKDPDDGDDQLIAQVAAGVQTAEDAIYADDFTDPDTGYRAHLDVDSFIDWYLVNELTKNVDSTFLASTWMSWSGGRVAMAAPWDFDFSAGNRTAYENTDPTGWYLRRNWWVEDVPRPGSMLSGPQGHWIVQLMKDPSFAQQVSERWREVAPRLRQLPQYIEDQAGEIESAAGRNFAPIDQGGAGHLIGATFIDGDDNHVHHGSWPAERDALSNWISQRVGWIDSQLGSTGP